MSQVATLSINITGNAAGLSSALSQAQSQLSSFGASLRGMGTKLTAAVSLPIAGVGAAAVKSAAQNEQLEIAFTTMLGSATKAKDLMADLADFAKTTPFGMPEVVGAGKQLLAFGVEAENIQETLRQLGDLSAGVGANIGDMAYLFGTAKAQGRLFMADINQFSNRGIPIIEALAATMGVATTEVRALVEEGKVGFPEMQAAIEHLTGEGSKFGGLMEAQSASLAGMWATLQDSIGMSLGTIGKAIVDAFDLKPKMAKALEFVDRLSTGFVELSKTNPALIRMGISVALVAAAVGPLLIGLGALAAAVSAALPVITAIGGALALLVSPVALAVVAVGALAAAFWRFDVGGVQTKVTAFADAAQQSFARVTAAFQEGAFSLRGLAGELVATLTGFGADIFDTADAWIELTMALTGSAEAGAKVQSVMWAIRERTAGLPDKLNEVRLALFWLSHGDFTDLDYWQGVVGWIERLSGADLGALDLDRKLLAAGLAAKDLLTPLREIGAATAQLAAGEIGFAAFAATVKGRLDDVANTVRGWAASVDWGSLLDSAGDAGAQLTAKIASWFEGIDFSAAFADVQAGWDKVTTTFDGWRDQLLTLATSAINSVDWSQASLDFSNFIGRISDGLAKLDFTQLDFTGLVGGKLFGWWSTGISAVQWVMDSTKFDGLKAAVTTALASIQWGDMLLTLSTLPESAATAFDSLRTAIFNHVAERITSINWAEASIDFANLLTAISTKIAEIPWGEIGQNVGETLRTIFVGTEDSQSAFAGLVDAVREAIVSIQWKEVLLATGDLLGSLTSAIVEFVTGAVNGLFGTTFDAGSFTAPQWVTDLTNWLAGIADPPPWVATLAAWWNGVRNGTVAFALSLSTWWANVTGGAVAWVEALAAWWENVTQTPAWVTSILGWWDSLSAWEWPKIETPEWLSKLESLWGKFSGLFSGINLFGGNQLGTAYWQGGPTWVGEGGPELIFAPRGAQIMPHRASERYAAGAGSVEVTVNATVANDVDIYALALRIKEVLRRGY